jgi:pyrimidine operon attenuation protein/uracil phosphoribosyltransferase
VILARRIAETIARIEPDAAPPQVGALDVTMYRDDLTRTRTRTPQPTELPPGGIDGKTVVLVDDVLYSGRTIRAAFDALSDLGRARAVRLAVLVDRGHREFPIRADFVGKNLPSSTRERINVRLAEIDGDDGVAIDDTAGTEGGEA